MYTLCRKDPFPLDLGKLTGTPEPEIHIWLLTDLGYMATGLGILYRTKILESSRRCAISLLRLLFWSSLSFEEWMDGKRISQ